MRSRRRSGYTLMELITVMAVLVVLGSMLAPTLRTLSRDSHVKAGSDILRGRIANARAAAIEEGQAYRLAVSTDGTRVRVAPDSTSQDSTSATDDPDGPTIIEDDFPKGVTVVPVFDEDSASVMDQNGWIRIATFLPDGTCREDSSTVEIRETDVTPLVVRIRGLTGTASTTTGTSAAGPGGKRL